MSLQSVGSQRFGHDLVTEQWQLEYTIWLCVTFLHHNIWLHTFGRNTRVVMLNSSHYIRSYVLSSFSNGSVHYEYLVKVVSARFLHYEITIFSFNGKMSCRRYLETMWVSYYFSNFYPLFLWFFFSKWRFSNSIILSTISVRFFSTMKSFLFSVLSVCEFYLCIYLCIYVFICVSLFLQFNATFKNNLIESNADLKRDMIKIQ